MILQWRMKWKAFPYICGRMAKQAAAATQTQAQRDNTAVKQRSTSKGNVFTQHSVHTLALIYGSKGPQRLNSLWSTELWEGGREDRPMVLVQTSNEQMNDHKWVKLNKRDNKNQGEVNKQSDVMNRQGEMTQNKTHIIFQSSLCDHLSVSSRLIELSR